MAKYELFYIVIPEPPKSIETASVGSTRYARLSLAYGDDGSYQHFRTEFGNEFNEDWARDGLPAIRVETEATGINEAIVQTYPDAKALVDSMSVLELKRLTGIDASPEKVLDLSNHLLVSGPDRFLEIVEFYVGGFVRLNLGDEKDKDDRLEQLLLRLLRELWSFEAHADLAGTQAGSRIRRFFRWYSSSRTARTAVEKFLAGWLSLETLVGCVEDKRGKGPALKSRLCTLTSLHMPDSDWEAVIERLWKFRGEILHEAAVTGRGDDLKQSTTMASEIWACRYLALLSAEFLVHATLPGATLFETWKTVANYHPQIILRFQEMPTVHSMPIIVRRLEIS